ncbi:hypothetical protein C8R43DRAFT_957556 [Mycena crocata]|nr:hypothetical protein C8R43DRAFT_957556 [Mycena crocata]
MTLLEEEAVRFRPRTFGFDFMGFLFGQITIVAYPVVVSCGFNRALCIRSASVGMSEMNRRLNMLSDHLVTKTHWRKSRLSHEHVSACDTETSFSGAAHRKAKFLSVLSSARRMEVKCMEEFGQLVEAYAESELVAFRDSPQWPLAENPLRKLLIMARAEKRKDPRL